MKSLLAKLEALIDEATLLVREERQRRNLAALKAQPTVNPPDWIPFMPPVPHPDLGEPYHWAPPIDITCAPNPFPLGTVIGTFELQPQLLGHLRHH